jgi:hypothetical protein
MSKEFFDIALLARLCKKMKKYIQNCAQLLVRFKYTILSLTGTVALQSVNIFFRIATVLQLAWNKNDIQHKKHYARSLFIILPLTIFV